MIYQALYRKWRPRTFDDVVGQNHITETLKRQMTSGRLSHAYLFVGTRGTGKTTCAKILARAVNCEAPENGNPCNRCASCLGIESGAVLDVEEMDAASNNGVDNIRALREEAVFTPASVKKRVYIVDEVHMLSPSAFNALLKILEEPPGHLIFILATTELHKVPATILSRCQRFSFKRISPKDIALRLGYVAEQEGIDLTPDAAELLSRLADGAMRDALSLLDQCASASGGVIDEKAVYEAVGLAGALDTAQLLRHIADGCISDALTLFDRLYYGGKDPYGVLGELSSLCRDVLIALVMPEGGGRLLSGNYTRTVIDSFSDIPKAKLLWLVNSMQSVLSDAARAQDRRTAAEMCLIELASPGLASAAASFDAPADMTEKRAVPAEPERKMPEKPVQEERSEPVALEEQPKKAAEPEKKSVPASEGKAAKPVNDNIWQEIFKAANGKLTPPQRMILDSRDNVTAEFSDNVLTVYVKNQFAENMVNVPAVTTALKSAAEEAVGAPCTVRIEKYEAKPERTAAAESADDKLDRLSRFSNVKFE